MIFIRKKVQIATTIILADSLLLNEIFLYWPVRVATFLFFLCCFLDIKMLRFAPLGFQLYIVLESIGLFISVRSNSHLVIQTCRTAGIHYTCTTLKLYKEQFLISITICLFLTKIILVAVLCNWAKNWSGYFSALLWKLLESFQIQRQWTLNTKYNLWYKSCLFLFFIG